MPILVETTAPFEVGDCVETPGGFPAKVLAVGHTEKTGWCVAVGYNDMGGGFEAREVGGPGGINPGDLTKIPCPEENAAWET